MAESGCCGRGLLDPASSDMEPAFPTPREELPSPAIERAALAASTSHGCMRPAAVAASASAALALCALAASPPARLRVEQAGERSSLVAVQNLEPGTTCTNWHEAVISSSLEATMDNCRDRCAATAGCEGLLYRRTNKVSNCQSVAQTCALTTRECVVGPDLCWEKVAVAEDRNYSVTWATGCSNWRSIQIGDTTTEATADDCFDRCLQMPGCLGFGFQRGSNGECTEGEARGQGACMLWKGPCVHMSNPCWAEHHMVAPTPAMFSLTGANTWCRNWDWVLLAQLPDLLATEDACAVQCSLTPGCTGFAFSPDSSCASTPNVGKRDCILFQGECIPEPNHCWNLYNMTKNSTRADIATMPMPIQPAYQRPFDGVQCDGWPDSLLGAPIVLGSEAACNAHCYSSHGCQGFSFERANGTCALWGQVCLNSSFKDTYQLLWPSLSPIAEEEGDTGCSNWREIKLGPAVLRQNKFSCALRCKQTLGCRAFNLQYSTCDDREESMERGACILFHGECKREKRGCWNYSTVLTDVSYAETTWPVTSTTTETTQTLRPQALRNGFQTIQKLAENAVAGETSISLIDESGFQVGDSITITDGANTQDNAIVSKGSLGLKDPLRYDFDAATAQVGLRKPSTSTSTSTTQVTTVTFTTTAAPSDCLTVFINEMRSRTSGASEACGIEIAGKEGTRLDGWQIQIFNTAGKQEGKTASLSGSISSAKVMWTSTPATSFAAAALLDKAGKLVQFVSMGSQVTAQDGADAVKGRTAGDIGLSLTSTSSESDSLQLKGSGACYKDFQWRVHANTEGEENGLQDLTFA